MYCTCINHDVLQADDRSLLTTDLGFLPALPQAKGGSEVLSVGYIGSLGFPHSRGFPRFMGFRRLL